jgi:hypothetical protein
MLLKLDQHVVLFLPNHKVSPSLPPLLCWNKRQSIDGAIFDADWSSLSAHAEITFVGLVVLFVSVDTLRLERTSVIALIASSTVAGIDIPDPGLLIDAQRFIPRRTSDIAAWSEALLADVRSIFSVEWISIHADAGK